MASGNRKPATVNLVLASRSEARKTIVSKLLRVTFPQLKLKIMSADVDERQIEKEFLREKKLTRETARALSKFLANAKLNAAVESLGENLGNDVVIGADQLLFYPGNVPGNKRARVNARILGKPSGFKDAQRSLRMLSGKRAYLFTSMVVARVDVSKNRIRKRTSVHTTVLDFADLPRAEIDRVIGLDRPYSAAGSFMFELHGAFLFRSVRSADPTGIQGISALQLRRDLELFLGATVKKTGC